LTEYLICERYHLPINASMCMNDIVILFYKIKYFLILLKNILHSVFLVIR